MKIIYEDEYIVVCIKPDGVLSQSNSGGGESAVSILHQLCSSEIYPIHRLDRTTLGVMVYAKQAKSAAILSRDVAEHNFKKKYVVIVHGIPDSPSGHMTDLLYFDRKKNKSYTVKRERAGVKKAELDYSLISSFGEETEKVSMLDITLGTGRTHQIRVQCVSRGMPLLGDRRYGAADEFKRIALCAVSLEFKHPVNHQIMSFSIKDTQEYADWENYFLKK